MKLAISDLTKVDLTEWTFSFGDGLAVISEALDEHIRSESEIGLAPLNEGLNVAIRIPLGSNKNMGIVAAEVSLSDLIDELIADEHNGAEDLEDVAARLRALAERLEKAADPIAPLSPN